MGACSAPAARRMPDYARRLRRPFYSGLLGRARRERCFEPAFSDLLDESLPAYAAAASPLRRLALRLRFEVLAFSLFCQSALLEAPAVSIVATAPSAGGPLLGAHDLTQALRGLLRRPGFLALVVAILALSIGANTAVFSAVRAVAFRPLPYPQADRLVHIWSTWPGGSGNMSFPDYRAILENSRSFETVGAYETWGTVSLTGDRDTAPVPLKPSFVTPSYFEMLQPPLVAGRTFRPDEDLKPGGHPVVLLSQALWTRQFGADPGLVGRTIVLNRAAYTVVGIVDQRFADLAAAEVPMPDLWLPTSMAESLLGQAPLSNVYRIFWGLGRLRPGVSVAQAQADLDAIAARLAEERPQTHMGSHLQTVPLVQYLRGPFRSATRLLAAGALLVLLIGCANVANLLLLRTADRRAEFAIRRSLGASDGALFRQLLAEALWFAALGGVLGALLAFGATTVLRAWVQQHVSAYLDVALDRSALAAALLLSLLTAAVFGVAPALAARRARMREDAVGRGAVGGGQRLRRALVCAEVAFAALLLVGAGLMLRSFREMTGSGLGFATGNLLTFRLELTTERYREEAARARFAEALQEKFASVPGIATTTLWGPSLLGRATWIIMLSPFERSGERPEDFVMIFRHSVNPGALGNLGIRIVRGRDLSADDRAGSPLVAVVSESVAAELWPGQDPVGRQVKRQLRDLPPITVVGVAADARQRERYSLADIAQGFPPGGSGPQRDIYFPYAQRPNVSLTAALRTQLPPAALVAPLRAAVRSLDPDLPLADIAALDERLAAQDVAPRSLATLLGAYAAVAVLLAALGIYGVLAHSVTRRRREIGVRMSLGADARAIFAMVLREGLGITAAGLVLGLGTALGATRMMRSLLFEVSHLDPATFASVGALLVVIAALAVIGPARRASSIDPQAALRSE